MPANSSYLTIGLVAAVCIGAMVWSAIEPGDGIGSRTLVAARDALSDTADWYRRGPADGKPDWEGASYAVHGGDAQRGAARMVQYGCGSCHVIPGVAGARGSVGPSLAGFRHRAYVAGVLPNDPGSLTRWLMNPTVHAPETAMPDLDVTQTHARDMAAYLYTLRDGA